MSLLADIVRTKEREILEARKSTRATTDRSPHDVHAKLARSNADPLRLITEVKFKSPSAGELSRSMNAASRALAYAQAGATMISILCDATYFGGSYADLSSARVALDDAHLAVPLLAKEFVIDEVQLDQARASGADAVLIIARIAEGDHLARLVEAAFARRLEPIVEVVDDAELARALATSARVLGVNARDLDTLVIDKDRATPVLAAIPPDRIALRFSGVRDAEGVRVAATSRADGALIGEALMREDDPAPLLHAFVAAACTTRSPSA